MEKTSLIEKIEVIKMPIRILILAGTLIVFAGLFIWLIYIPKTEQISITQASIKKLEVELNRAKDQRKKRSGSLLLKSLLAAAKKDGYFHVFLSADSGELNNLIKFYESQGFKRVYLRMYGTL